VEVTASLQFTRPSLGNVRRSDYDRMQRDQDGNVIFLPSWWRAAFAQAAKAISKYYKFVDMIHPGLPVIGTLSRVKRWYSSKRYKIHEGFAVGTKVQVSFLLPNELSQNEFAELLEATGSYIGMSPYGWKTGMYGHFKLLEVRKGGIRSNQEGGQSAADNASVSGHTGSSADVQASPAGGTERPQHDVRTDDAVRGEGNA